MNPSLTALGRYAIRVDHVAIAVRDLEASIALHRLLGFQLAERRGTQGKSTGMLSAVLTGGAVTLVLVQGTAPESQVNRYINNYGPGVQHIAIEVRDLESLRKELADAGVEFCTSLIEGSGIRQMFTVRDRGAGMMYEFIERETNDGHFTDQSVKELFEQLEKNDAY